MTLRARSGPATAGPEGGSLREQSLFLFISTPLYILCSEGQTLSVQVHSRVVGAAWGVLFSSVSWWLCLWGWCLFPHPHIRWAGGSLFPSTRETRSLG